MFRFIVFYSLIISIFFSCSFEIAGSLGGLVKEMYEAANESSDEKSSDDETKKHSEEQSSEEKSKEEEQKSDEKKSDEKTSDEKTSDEKTDKRPEVFEIVPAEVKLDDQSSNESSDEKSSGKRDDEERFSVQKDSKKEKSREVGKSEASSEVLEKNNVQKQENATVVGDFDTTVLQEPRGNWLIKRIWLQKAERVASEVNDLISQLLDLSMDFHDQRDTFEGEVIEPFYLAIGMDRGVLMEKVEKLVEKIENRREDEGDLSEPERAFLDKLHAEKDTLKRLSKEIESVAYLEDLLEQALNRLKERLKVARRYQHEVNDMLQTIAMEKSDAYARVLYEKIEHRVNNISDINAFIAGEFKNSFDNALRKIRESIDHIKITVDVLKKNNLLLQDELLELEEQASDVPVSAPVEEVKTQEKKSWWSKAWSTITNFFS